MADIVDRLAKRVGAAKASQWMLSPCPKLGDACSPIMALRDGRAGDVIASAESFCTKPD